MDYSLRKVLEEIIEPGQGDDLEVKIEDPNDPEKNAKKDKMKYRPQANMQQYNSANRKTWMPPGGKS